MEKIYTSTVARDTLTLALINASFAITRNWLVKTEVESSMHIKGKAAALTTILLVCCPHNENPFPKPWREVKELIDREVQEDIRDNLAPADLCSINLYLRAFGPALRVISEHWRTEREVVNPKCPATPFLVTLTDALQVARREVNRRRAQTISKQWVDNPADSATKFYILAKDAVTNDTLLFDEANLLAHAIGITLEKNNPALKHMVSFKGDKLSLPTAPDRLAARNIGEDIKHDTTLNAVHPAVALADRHNTLERQQWLPNSFIDPYDSWFRATKPGHDDHQAQRNLWQALYGAEPPQPAGV